MSRFCSIRFANACSKQGFVTAGMGNVRSLDFTGAISVISVAPKRNF